MKEHSEQNMLFRFSQPTQLLISWINGSSKLAFDPQILKSTKYREKNPPKLQKFLRVATINWMVITTTMTKNHQTHKCLTKARTIHSVKSKRRELTVNWQGVYRPPRLSESPGKKS